MRDQPIFQLINHRQAARATDVLHACKLTQRELCLPLLPYEPPGNLGQRRYANRGFNTRTFTALGLAVSFPDGSGLTQQALLS